jgi:acyl carrier protein
MDTLANQDELSSFLALVRNHLKLLDDAQELSFDASLSSLGLDSAAALNLMLDLEDAFAVVFEESMFTEENFASPRALWRSLESLRDPG